MPNIVMPKHTKNDQTGSRYSHTMSWQLKIQKISTQIKSSKQSFAVQELPDPTPSRLKVSLYNFG